MQLHRHEDAAQVRKRPFGWSMAVQVPGAALDLSRTLMHSLFIQIESKTHLVVNWSSGDRLVSRARSQ